MILDCYNNVWEASGQGSDYLVTQSHGAEQLVAAMDAAGVDRAVACSLGQQIDNDYIAGAVRRHPSRLVGFGQVNPRLPGAAEEIARCRNLGLQGLKLHPTIHGYEFADHGLLDPVFAAAEAARLVVLVNALDDPFCHPFAIEEIARGFPAVPVVLAHMGTVWNVTAALRAAARTPNLYLDTSTAQLLEVRMAYDQLGPDRVLMGTDWPGSDFDLELLKVRKAVPDEGDRAKVQGGNLAALLER